MDTTKVCSRCHQRKPVTAFYVYTAHDHHRTGGLHAACKRCQHDRRAAHRAAQPELAAANARRWKLRRAGVTPEQYEARLAEQGGVCAICVRPSPDGRRLHADHDHRTKRFRGLLCHDCNRGLGIFRDDPERLRRAVAYLLGTKPANCSSK